MPTNPIFIVGVPRSGTTLLAAMLAAHPRISCGPETHFFRRLASLDADSLCEPALWPDLAVNFISSITHTSFNDATRKPLLEKYKIQPEQVSKFLSQRPPSIPNILASVTEQYMEVQGKCRWAEKTPDHMKYVSSIRKYFPESPIIRILRDPRDVALSLARVPWGASSFVEALFLWKHYDETSSLFFERDEKSYTLRYEDLVISPETELLKLCQFLGEKFESSMLDTSSTGKQINSRNVAWKEKVSQPIDTSRVAVWKLDLAKEDNLLSEALLGKQMDKYGYPREVEFRSYGEAYPTRFLSEKYGEALKK